MGRKTIAWVLAGVGFIIFLVVGVSLLVFPDAWPKTPQGLVRLVVAAVVGVTAFVKGILDILKGVKDLTVKPKSTDRVDTGGGSYVDGDVKVGHDFIGRDKVVYGDEIVIYSPGETAPPPVTDLHQLPTDLADFTGRYDELVRIRAALLDGGCVTINGVGGVGKSALAIHAAYLMSELYPGGQLYVDVRDADGQPLALIDALSELLRALGVHNQRIPERLGERASLYRSLVTGRRLLLLLDNAQDEAQVRQLLPGDRSTAVLITSRKRLSGLEGTVVLDVPMMVEGDGLELLCRLAGSERVEAEPEAARRILRLCGQLPLAIRIAGAKLRDRPNWKLETYASRLDNERRRLARLSLGDLSVRASFALSYQDLDVDDARLFHLLAVAGRNFLPEMAALLIGTDLDTAWEALERLADLRLLEPTGDESYRFHDLMQLFAKEKLDETETAQEQQAARERAGRWYLAAPNVHFYTQAGILDIYVHSPDPAAHPDMLEAILTVLRTRGDLRKYFFRSAPSVAWAPILYSHGFFESPPNPEITEQGSFLVPWDVLYYLPSVAAGAPDVVVQVAESIDAPAGYLSQVIRALQEVSAAQVAGLLPRLTEWLNDPNIAQGVSTECARLVSKLAQDGELSASLELLESVTAPIPPATPEIDNPYVGLFVESQSKFPVRHDLEVEQLFEVTVPRLSRLAPERVVGIFEEHLRAAIRLEQETAGSLSSLLGSGWRIAVEDTGQDRDDRYKDQLLVSLRDAVERLAEVDREATTTLVERYLCSDIEILRRLGLHILRRSPERYTTLVIAELRKAENLDDLVIHHEFLGLLRSGFGLLDAQDRAELLLTICSGPPLAHLKRMAEWAIQNRGTDDLEEYLEIHVKRWTRERLWMVQGYLTGEEAALLDSLNAELGEPGIPPGFTRWTSGAGFIAEVSPIPAEELASLSPQELVEYLREWQPDAQQAHSFRDASYQGLADTVSQVVLATPQTYEASLRGIASAGPVYTQSILIRILSETPMTVESWTFGLALCEAILQSQERRTSIEWLQTRREAVRLVCRGVTYRDFDLATEVLERIRDVLVRLLDDPDPDEVTEAAPEESYARGLKEPVANYAVRPSALSGLIEYADRRLRPVTDADQIDSGIGSAQAMDDVVRETLTRKLDRTVDPSRAVHSIYGQHLHRLYTLDRDWLHSHLGAIFPEADDKKSREYYEVAWNAYLSHHWFWHPDLEFLRPKYVQAIQSADRGTVSQMVGQLDPVDSLAVHIAFDYVQSGYDFHSPGGPGNLLMLLYEEGMPQAHASVAWLFWRYLGDNPQSRSVEWPKIRAVWEWRAAQAADAGYPPEYGDEMTKFALMVPLIPDCETIETLWPLLQSLLLYITQSKYRTHEWDAVEKYLASEVDRDPVRVIELYHQMFSLKPAFDMYLIPEECRKIIGTAAAGTEARREALALIDLLAQQGNHEFREVYDRYASG